MTGGRTGYYKSERHSRGLQEKRLSLEKRKQAGVTFPSARKQEYLLIVRLNIEPSALAKGDHVRKGLKTLGALFDKIDSGMATIDQLTDDGSMESIPISEFNFSATVGFGVGFFEKLQVKIEKRPRNLYEMPNHIGLLDPVPYRLLQTDIIIQVGSSRDFINRWVFESDIYDVSRYEGTIRNPVSRKERNHANNVHDIVTAINGWAVVTDVHSGFQRMDGRNLMGFNDGVSNADRLNNDVVWTTVEDEGKILKDGTYMVFNKIEHDLQQWARLSEREKERWVGRSKGTGLLLGTLSKDEDDILALNLRSENPTVRKNASLRLRVLLEGQNDPDISIFDRKDASSLSIQAECPVWSHVRKANPRGYGGAQKVKIFRRGYLYMENSPEGKVSSGLLFICFQRDIGRGFEYIKKRFLNNKDFPVPEMGKGFTQEELAERHRHGRFSRSELERLRPAEKSLLGLDKSSLFSDALSESRDPDSQNTGREGLCGPSKLGINPEGEFLATVSLGGGYYFIPPIFNRKLSDIADQFFG